MKSYDPLQDGISRLEYIDHMGEDSSVVRAARVSYAADDRTGVDVGSDEKLIKYMASHGHTSPFEHCTVTFNVECPLFVRSQWHRHRMFSYNEISRRYTSEDINFYYPLEYRLQDDKNKQGSKDSLSGAGYIWANRRLKFACEDAMSIYQQFLDMGIAREQARMILPQNLYTRFYATGNLHSWQHFYKLRADEHAQYEIRVYAEAIGEILNQLFPISWPALTQ